MADELRPESRSLPSWLKPGIWVRSTLSPYLGRAFVLFVDREHCKGGFQYHLEKPFSPHSRSDGWQTGGTVYAIGLEHWEPCEEAVPSEIVPPQWLVRAGGDNYETWLCPDVAAVQKALCEALFGDAESADAHEIGLYMADFQRKEWDQEVLRWTFEDGWLEVVRLYAANRQESKT